MVTFDLCWRLLVISFDRLVVDAAAVGILGALLIALFIWRHRRAQTTSVKT
jgi:hypothetical protein